MKSLSLVIESLFPHSQKTWFFFVAGEITRQKGEVPV